MNQFLKELFYDVGDYFSQGRLAVGTFDFWLTPILVVLVIWLLTIILTKVVYQNKDVYNYKKTYYIFHAWISSSIIVATILIGVMITLYLRRFYILNPVDLRLSHLISLLICFIFSIVSFIMLSKYYKQNNMREITDFPATQIQENNSILKAKKSYTRIKLWLLVPLVAFLLMTLQLRRSSDIISIVLDTSDSMFPEEIDKGKDALINTFNSLRPKTIIFFTNLKGMNPYEYFAYEDIISKDFEGSYSLHANTYRLNPASAINHVLALGENAEDMSGGTPLTEGIWQNFRTVENAIQQSPQLEKVDHKMVIITDCKEEAMECDPALTDIEEFAEVFPAGSIQIIDLIDGGADGYPFYDCMIYEQGVPSLPGSTIGDYSSALTNIMPSFNTYFIIWAAIIYVLASIIILFIKPAKLR